MLQLTYPGESTWRISLSSSRTWPGPCWPCCSGPTRSPRSSGPAATGRRWSGDLARKNHSMRRLFLK